MFSYFNVAVLSAGVVGLCLTYAKLLTGMFQYCIRTSAEVESLVSKMAMIMIKKLNEKCDNGELTVVSLWPF